MRSASCIGRCGSHPDPACHSWKHSGHWQTQSHAGGVSLRLARAVSCWNKATANTGFSCSGHCARHQAFPAEHLWKAEDSCLKDLSTSSKWVASLKATPNTSFNNCLTPQWPISTSIKREGHANVLASHVFKQLTGGQMWTMRHKIHTFGQGELPHSFGLRVPNIHSPVFRSNDIMRHVKVLEGTETRVRPRGLPAPAQHYCWNTLCLRADIPSFTHSSVPSLPRHNAKRRGPLFADFLVFKSKHFQGDFF